MNSSNSLINTLGGKHDLLKALRSQIWKDVEECTKKVLNNKDGELGNESAYESISNLLSLEWKVNMNILQLKKVAERVAVKQGVRV